MRAQTGRCAPWPPGPLDPGQGTITVPGCVSAVLVERPIDIEEGLNSEVPLVFFYGHAAPGENAPLFKVSTPTALRARSSC